VPAVAPAKLGQSWPMHDLVQAGSRPPPCTPGNFTASLVLGNLPYALLRPQLGRSLVRLTLVRGVKSPGITSISATRSLLHCEQILGAVVVDDHRRGERLQSKRSCRWTVRALGNSGRADGRLRVRLEKNAVLRPLCARALKNSRSGVAVAADGG